LKEGRPNFRDIKSFEEFSRYYWYREELAEICKSLELEYRCTKQELNHIIEQYFKGNRVEKSVKKLTKNQTKAITLNTRLFECGFSFNQKFREYFSAVTGINPFKFNADMATAWRKVKAENDWNQFLKDFCSDEFSDYYSDKLKVAAILWKEVRDSKNEKIYSRQLLNEYGDKIEEYHK